MLRQRVITALILAGLLLAAIIYLDIPSLALFFGVFVALGAWEWSGMAGWSATLARLCYVAVLMIAMAALYVVCQLGDAPDAKQVQPFLGLACLWWSIALLWLKSYPASGALWGNRAMRSIMGILVLVPAWMAAVYLLSYPRGGLMVIALIAVVASADIGAYFSGKSLGKHKLAPKVSPGKTWEGFWGGIFSCLLLAVIVWRFLPTASDHIGLAAVITVFITTALASVVGDLVVSMVKRESGVKDSGSLLPGHGGILDRLDSICGAAPVFALGLILAGW
ncbi:MAG: phosphatidate cytidylyltransferase [Halioglobus sp.]